MKSYFLKNLNTFCKLTSVPCISDNTADFLSEQLYIYKPTNYLEIGCAAGYSIIYISSIIGLRNGKSTGFEISYPNIAQARNHIYASGLDNIDLHYMNFNLFDTQKRIDKSITFDFVMIDARKSDYHKFLQKIRPFVVDGGVIIIDDVIKYKDKMPELYEFLKTEKIYFDLISLDKDDGVIKIIKNIGHLQ